MSMGKITLAPGQLLHLFTWRKVTSARRVTRCCTTGNPPLEVAPGQRKTHVNSYRRQTVHRGKVNPWVSELPQGNELSRDQALNIIIFFLVSELIQKREKVYIYSTFAARTNPRGGFQKCCSSLWEESQLLCESKAIYRRLLNSDIFSLHIMKKIFIVPKRLSLKGAL